MSSRLQSKRGASKTKKKPSLYVGSLSNVPGWLWLVTGVAAGFLIAFLLRGSPNNQFRQVEANKSTLAKNNTLPTPVFDFYTLLPESKVTTGEDKQLLVVDNNPQDKGKPVLGEKQSLISPHFDAHQDKSVRYILQAGSFKSLKDAERLRTQLLQWKLEPQVKKVDIGGGEYWHRVQVGPFTSQPSLENARQILVDNKIDTLLLKIK
ncbi:MAG: SPOR domain-containing protein [Endozoicomonas sp. (ex Botrylloides leachii)]|nr:SPOR domain-containing protein [Endozoicomonas sp. (ex Botrylloides leachii)]